MRTSGTKSLQTPKAEPSERDGGRGPSRARQEASRLNTYCLNSGHTQYVNGIA